MDILKYFPEKMLCIFVSCSIFTTLTPNASFAVKQVNGTFMLPELELPANASALDKIIINAMKEAHIVGLSAAVLKGDKAV